MVFDPREELRQLAEWHLEETHEGLDVELIVTKVVTGFERCEDFCSSKEVCGEDCCYCIRSNFPSPQHYEMYKELTRDASKLTALSILMTVMGSQNGENSNGEANTD